MEVDVKSARARQVTVVLSACAERDEQRDRPVEAMALLPMDPGHAGDRAVARPARHPHRPDRCSILASSASGNERCAAGWLAGAGAGAGAGQRDGGERLTRNCTAQGR